MLHVPRRVQGTVEAYWEYQLKPWDVCAGIAILAAAGGRITTMDGSRYSPFHRSLLATNGGMHDYLVGVMAGPTRGLVGEHGVNLTPAFVPPGYDAGWVREDMMR